jgi:hypothetical protein
MNDQTSPRPLNPYAQSWWFRNSNTEASMIEILTEFNAYMVKMRFANSGAFVLSLMDHCSISMDELPVVEDMLDKYLENPEP